MSAFSIPLSGLSATSSELNVIANNLANLNTDGFKDETLNFGDIMNAATGNSGNGDPIQIGSGVEVEGTTSNFTNGSPTSTGVPSNMALQGNGFFVVQNSNGTESYTRAGDFTTNNAGQLVTPSGQLVMGFPATNGVVSTSGALAPINVGESNTVPGTASTSFSVEANLNSNAAAGTTFNAPITVYDSLGNPLQLNVQFTNNSAGNWSYSVTVPSSNITGGTGTTTQVGSGTLTFNSSGQLTSPAGSVTGINVTGLADGAANMSMSWNLNGTGTSPIITQLASDSTSSNPTTNGFPDGTLTSYTVESNGTVEGTFSNNQTLALGQVAVAQFANVQGLQQSSSTDYQATLASGQAAVGQANGTTSVITGGSVEGSNVNLSAEFANMIVAQQGYEANAKVLTTLDQVSQATIQLIS
ncbi:flagellar hook protein FlgE [Silvibacterium bohemicum]|uniref:Flagellar hook protein FlgE n=1 Tax=Silvibacterium bohemicum TaxID=1577686 RepID=A0A841JUI0_9BACT|nr:flagellar hook protein FlgE [Silvibacterium bohemicum]MBB6145006.1 flagellar hook protein FlgE [Silvibacterium bohemicum]